MSSRFSKTFYPLSPHEAGDGYSQNGQEMGFVENRQFPFNRLFRCSTELLTEVENEPDFIIEEITRHRMGALVC